jgi:outer membrane cobalamin receptor
MSAGRAGRGIEAELKLRPVDALLFEMSYSYSKPTDLQTQRDLPRRPRHKAYASVGLSLVFRPQHRRERHPCRREL